MELVSLVKEVLQTAAERAASYRFGQSALRYMDRGLWIVEKSARWAVPPPLDQDERPQPELVRPLPWVFFLALLIVLRITRECISLVNLALGKPPLRSADVVTYIQGKRRYLRTLKYAGNRWMRARSEQLSSESWWRQLQSLLELTMCFRRQRRGNNTQLINGDEVLVVKRNKKTRPEASTVASTGETSMERLIEKMMVDVEVDSDESSAYTLTNLTSGRSDKSDYNTESDQESNTKTQVKHNQDDGTVKQTQDDTSLPATDTKTKVKEIPDDGTVKQNQEDKTLKQTQDNTLLPANNTKPQVKTNQDDGTVKQTQDNTSLTTTNTKPQVKTTQNDGTVKQTQDNTSLTTTNTKPQVKTNQNDGTVKQTQDNTSLTTNNTKPQVKINEDDRTVKQTQDKTSLSATNIKTQVKKNPNTSPKGNNITTSTPKKSKKDKSYSEQSKDSMKRLERNSDTKEATMDFIQNESGSQRTENSQHKIANGRMMQDLTATGR